MHLQKGVGIGKAVGIAAKRWTQQGGPDFSERSDCGEECHYV